MKTTVMKLPTDCVKFTEPTLSRVSPVVAKMAHTDGVTFHGIYKFPAGFIYIYYQYALRGHFRSGLFRLS